MFKREEGKPNSFACCIAIKVVTALIDSYMLSYRAGEPNVLTWTMTTASWSLITSHSPSDAITTKLSSAIARRRVTSGSHSINLKTANLQLSGLALPPQPVALGFC